MDSLLLLRISSIHVREYLHRVVDEKTLASQSSFSSYFMRPLWSHSRRRSPARWSRRALRMRCWAASSAFESLTKLPETATLFSKFSTLCGDPAGTKSTWPGSKTRLYGRSIFMVVASSVMASVRSMSKTGSKLSKYRGLKRSVMRGSKKVHFFRPSNSAIQKCEPKASICNSLTAPFKEEKLILIVQTLFNSKSDLLVLLFLVNFYPHISVNSNTAVRHDNF